MLQSWYENEGWDELVIGVIGTVVDRDSLASDCFNDHSLRYDEGISRRKKISNQQRIDYARQNFSTACDQAMDSFHAIELKKRGRPSAFLACMVYGQGQGGWDVQWCGIFPSKETAMGKGRGNIGDEITDAEILKLWRKSSSI